MKKTKVMFVLLQLDAGGSERVVLDLARNLDPQQYEIYLAAFKGGVLEASLKKVCKEVFYIEKKRGIDFFAMIRLAKIIRDNDINVINTHHYMPCFYSFFGSKIWNRRRLIYTEHSVPEVNEIVNGVHGKIFNWMLYQVNMVIGVSNEITAKFKVSYPRHTDKFVVILNGVDIEKFSVRVSREAIRIRWGLLQEHFVVGTVANFRKVKNHVCLVRAAARLKNSYPQLRLFFVGAGFPDDLENSEYAVRELVRELNLQDCVIFAGYQEHIPEILQALDVFCLPSISEGLPVSILEAMAAGLPVVGSRVRGIKEIVNDRKTGLLFESDDDLNLADCLEELLNSKIFSQTLANFASDYVGKMHGNKAWTGKVSQLFLADG